MTGADIRRMYGVDFKRGDRITVDGKPGVITGFSGHYLVVRFDDEGLPHLAHPTWRVERAS